MGTGTIPIEKPASPVSHLEAWRRFIPVAAIVVLAFGRPLWRLLDFALHDEFFSYILLIPFISIYVIWHERRKTQGVTPVPWLTTGFFLAGAVLTGWHWLAPAHNPEDSLARTTLAFLMFLLGAASWRLGGRTLKTFAFAFGMLIFMVPMPMVMLNGIEAGLQTGSAFVADLMFEAAMTPVMQDRLAFALPGIQLQVAPECSGIHSTMVLFITSLIAGHYFLNRPWKRVVLCLVVLPLALLRNGFRIFVIGEMCVHIGPQMINSVVHRHGGPLFFLLSLIPFFYLIKYLRKSGRAETVDPKEEATK
jgi:exosortase C (VPDSG-CTERM-specific)